MGFGQLDRVLARVSNTSCELIDQQPWSLELQCRTMIWLFSLWISLD